jgi:hypothetical protein
MAANEPIYNWDDDQSDAPVEELPEQELRPAALRSLPSSGSPVEAVRPTALTLGQLRAVACWTFLLTAGLAVWIGAIYGFLVLLTDSFT